MGDVRRVRSLEERFAGDGGVGVGSIVLLDDSVQIAVDGAGIKVVLVGNLFDREPLVSEL